MDWEQVVREMWASEPFTGTHPAVMKQWIEDHRQYEEVFA